MGVATKISWQLWPATNDLTWHSVLPLRLFIFFWPDKNERRVETLRPVHICPTDEWRPRTVSGSVLGSVGTSLPSSWVQWTVYTTSDARATSSGRSAGRGALSAAEPSPNVIVAQMWSEAVRRQSSHTHDTARGHLAAARAGGGPRTGLDSRPPAARLSLQYGRYSLPRWSSSLISTPNLDDRVSRYRSELMRVHCTYSYTHFKGKAGALALRSNEATVPFAGTFRTGVGGGRGLAGEASPSLTPPRRASPFYEWKAAMLNEPRTRRARGRGREPRGGAGGRRKRAANACGAKFCGAGGGGGCTRLPSFRRDPPARRIRELGFRLMRRVTGMPPTVCRSACTPR